MHRVFTLSLLISFPILILSQAQDPAAADSLHAGDTLFNKGELAPVNYSLNDSLSSNGGDSLKDTVTSVNLPSGTIGLSRNGIKKVLRIVFKYFRYFFILLICSGVIVLVVSFYRKKADSGRFLTSTRLSIMDREVQIACKYIESHYNDPELSVESMCEKLVTGPAFLEALFAKELGMSVPDFLAQVRINRAKIILEKRSDSTVDDIALQVGFNDKKLFLQKFKEITNLAFDEYQNSIQDKEQV